MNEGRKTMLFGFLGLGPVELAILAVTFFGGVGIVVYLLMGTGKGDE